MRHWILLFVFLGLFLPPSDAQEKSGTIEDLQTEIARLREENARLLQQIHKLEKNSQQDVGELKETRKLQGIWIIVTARLDGKDVPSDKGGEIEFQGNDVMAKMPGKKDLIRQRFGILPSANRIDFRSLPLAFGEDWKPTGTSFDRACGRYQWYGEYLQISLQSVYTLPTEISDTRQVLWVLKRKK